MLKIKEHIFYRNYENFTLLYDTYKKNIYKFSKSIGLILDGIKDNKTKEEIINLIQLIFSLDYVNAEKHYIECIELLIKESIIYKIFSTDVTLEEKCIYEISSECNLYSVIFELTYKCNEKCRHCYVCDNNQKELSLKEYEKVFSELRKMNVFELTFTGGEILCRKDFIEIYNLAVDYGFVVDLFTNGTMFTDKEFIALARKHPRSVHLSIYSYKAAKHDYITQVAGSFRKTINTAKVIRDIGIAVNFKTILLKSNYKDMQKIIDFAKDFGATIQIGTSFRLKHDGGHQPLEYSIDEEQFMEIMPDILNQMENPTDSKIEKRKANSSICLAGRSSINVNPYGKVYACGSLPIEMGDIRKESINDIWVGKKLSKWRQNKFGMIEDCAQCEYSSICAFCPGIAMQMTGSPYKKYKQACILSNATLKYINTRR